MKKPYSEPMPVRVSIDALLPIILSCFEQGQSVILTITGNSMAPFLRDGRDQVILKKADPNTVKPFDVPFVRRQNGSLVLHRAVGVERQNGAISYTLLGDAQTVTETGIKPEQILAVADAFIIRGKRISCDAPVYRRRVVRWHRLLPMRRFLLFLSFLPERAAGFLRRRVKR